MPEVVKVWVSIVDDRTTLNCVEAHGQTVPVDQPFRLINGDMDGPPAHFRCRSLVDIDYVKSSDLTRPDVKGNRYRKADRRQGRAELSARRKVRGARMRTDLERAQRARIPTRRIAR